MGVVLRRTAIAIGVLGALAVLAAAPVYAASASDDDLTGAWTITTTFVSSEVTGPGAASQQDTFKTLEPQTNTYTISCTASACSADSGFISAFNRTTELLATGDGAWRSESPFNPVSPCQDGNSLVVRLVRQGSQLTGTAEVIEGTSSPITDGAGGCITPEIAYVIHASFAITGKLVNDGAAAPVPTTRGSSNDGGSSSRAPARAAAMALTERQVESAAAVARDDRSVVPAALVTPREAFSDMGRTAQNALLAALLVLLLVFPSQLFNSTWEKHHDRIVDALDRWRPGRHRADAPPASAPTPTRRSQMQTFVVVAAAGAVLGGFLDPGFGLDQTSVALVLGVLLSILAGVAVARLAGVGYRRRRHLPAGGGLRAIPAGLAIAGVCVLVSRLVDFRPGYLYGLVGGFVFATALEARDAGRAQLAALAAGLGVALLAWIGFVPVSHAANEANPGFVIQLLDALLAALFIGGIEGLLFSLVPVQFMPGHQVARFSWIAWAVSAGITAFVFVEVLLRPANGYLGASSTASVVVTYGLFVAFGLASVLFWSWFRFRADPRPAPAKVEAG